MTSRASVTGFFQIQTLHSTILCAFVRKTASFQTTICFISGVNRCGKLFWDKVTTNKKDRTDKFHAIIHKRTFSEIIESVVIAFAFFFRVFVCVCESKYVVIVFVCYCTRRSSRFRRFVAVVIVVIIILNSSLLCWCRHILQCVYVWFCVYL